MLVLLLNVALLVPGFEEPPTPIALHPGNPHYLLFQGEPTILVTSGEHYGAVLNLDFDFEPYLDELDRSGLNLTRTFAGTYREVPGSFQIRDNTLAPRPNRYLAPWARVAEASEGLPERFDLDQFEPAYFERLNRFINKAARCGVVVELVLFCPLYEEELWKVNPMNAANNVNGVGDCPREEVYTLKHPELLKRQLAFVERVVTETNEHPNLYYEICNEPYFGGVTLDWQREVAKRIAATEAKLTRKHLIAQNIANGQQKVTAPVHPSVSILNFHYAKPAAALENRGLGRALGDDETGFVGCDDRPYRTEAWRFLLSGGSIFSHLDYSFTPEFEDGTAKVEPPTPGGGGPAIRSQLRFLKTFLESYEFLRMEPVEGVVVGGVPEGGSADVLAEPGRQYAIYLSHGATDAVELELPAGTYGFVWVDPVTSQYVETGGFEHAGGRRRIAAPKTREDLALKVLGPGAKVRAPSR